jgi:hypothetical protein
MGNVASGLPVWEISLGGHFLVGRPSQAAHYPGGTEARPTEIFQF